MLFLDAQELELDHAAVTHGAVHADDAGAPLEVAVLSPRRRPATSLPAHDPASQASTPMPAGDGCAWSGANGTAAITPVITSRRPTPRAMDRMIASGQIRAAARAAWSPARRRRRARSAWLAARRAGEADAVRRRLRVEAGRERRRRRIRHHAERHDDDRIAGAGREAGARAAGSEDRVELVRPSARASMP